VTVQSVVSDPAAPVRLASDLLGAQTQSGGWPAFPPGPADSESTAFASLALAASAAGGADRRAMLAAAEHGLAWLRQRQQADGGWPLTDQVPGSTWTTAPVVLALAAAARDDERVRRGTTWLVSRKGTGYGLAARLLRRLTGAEDRREVIELDLNIAGWPWADGTLSWVEPTALAVLALRAALARGAVADAEAASQRIGEAVRLFADRKSPGGGWNYGNRRVLGHDMEPYPDTTAWALLALRPVGDEATKESIARLGKLMQDTRSPLARALAVLALRAHGEDARAVMEPLAAQCAGRSADSPPRDTRSRALALLALAGPPRPLEAA
jgi:hypothetical protein